MCAISFTRDPLYLEKANYHYKQLISMHKFPKGYADMVDTTDMFPYDTYNDYPALVYDNAPILSILSLQNTIIPNSAISIDWGYGLSTSLPNEYNFPGMFTKMIKKKSMKIKNSSQNQVAILDCDP